MINTRSYEIKLYPNKSQEQQLSDYFYESKLLYNYLLTCNNVFAVNSSKVTHVHKLDKDGNQIQVSLTKLPHKLKQNVQRSIMSSIKGLSVLKKHGKKVGRLKFKSRIKSINIDNQSYWVKDEHHITLLGFKGESIRCRGLNQLYGNVVKFKGSVLQHRSSGFYMILTVAKEEPEHEVVNKNLGLDMGIKDSLIFSNGEKYKCLVEEPVRLKKIQRKMAKSLRINNKKRTNNYRKLQNKLHREYEKLDNIKSEFKHQMMHKFNDYDHIVFQNESLQSWKNLKSNRKTIQHSCLGSIKQALIAKTEEQPGRYIMIDKWEATTQTCPRCGKKNPHELDERIYRCSCGYTEDRDVHAAKNMLRFANLM